MNDDIVTRLRGKEHGDNDRRCKSCDSFCCHCELCDCCLEILEVCLEAADEIERLRAIIQDIANAITDEGIKPGYHKQQVNYVRTMWNPLWQAISKAVKEMENGTSKP